LTSRQKTKATRLIKLVSLDKMPADDPAAPDLRWNDRRESWDKATRYRTKYQNGSSTVETIVDLCKGDGHWSIWMTVFEGNKDVRLALISAFSGTVSAKCFNPDGNPIQRQGEQI
jgi:hypothetical protein